MADDLPVVEETEEPISNVNNSILSSVKKALGIEEEYTHFDPDIILNINSVLMTLNQIGIGPSTGFVITDKEDLWADLLGDRIDLASVKTFIYLKVRLLFDPPTSAFLLEAIERLASEMEWRLLVQVERPVILVEEDVEDE